MSKWVKCGDKRVNVEQVTACTVNTFTSDNPRCAYIARLVGGDELCLSHAEAEPLLAAIDAEISGQALQRAAPVLLAACEAVMEENRIHCAMFAQSVMDLDVLQRVEAAIAVAKAKGGA